MDGLNASFTPSLTWTCWNLTGGLMTGTCLINNWCHKTSARSATKFDSRRLLERNSKQHAEILKRHGELWLGIGYRQFALFIAFSLTLEISLARWAMMAMAWLSSTTDLDSIVTVAS
mmetsp:Transcript_2014/g.3618  ORF Transcript_2014/g.3618 Transcript_2014/m.3618 type:complete len:117 (+) Transcript_2014:925-1275(+)